MRIFPLLLLSFWPVATIACAPISDSVLDAGQGRELSYRFTPGNVSVGKHFSVEIMLCRDGEPVVDDAVKIDARMPAHGHGMNYRPTLASPAPGKTVARGLLLHMPGEWEFTFDIGSGESHRRLRIDYSL